MGASWCNSIHVSVAEDVRAGSDSPIRLPIRAESMLWKKLMLCDSLFSDSEAAFRTEPSVRGLAAVTRTNGLLTLGLCSDCLPQTIHAWHICFWCLQDDRVWQAALLFASMALQRETMRPGRLQQEPAGSAACLSDILEATGVR